MTIKQLKLYAKRSVSLFIMIEGMRIQLEHIDAIKCNAEVMQNCDLYEYGKIDGIKHTLEYWLHEPEKAYNGGE